ncbi:MAG: binding-protein-dependent transport system inner rane component [Clostridiales bacterium]|jgi:NitT/TauT family transport system permease protein|nr:binding-protein-dependent transport system inner rane component [Clostridiales bacterium]
MKSKNIRRVTAFIIILLMWQAFSMVARVPFIPSPFRVLETIGSIFQNKILMHSLYSLFRIFAGIFLSMAIGIPVGLLMGYFNRLDNILSPFIYFVYPVPKIALLPIVMLLFGIGEASKIIMIMLIVLFQIVVAARDGVKDISKENYYSYISLGASKGRIFKDIILPASLPGLLTSTRISLGTAISVLFFTETFGTKYGMGYFIMDSWMRVNYLEMYSGIVVLSIIGFLLFMLVDKLEDRVCLWR